jgi:gamma-glutamyltranspeptidase
LGVEKAGAGSALATHYMAEAMRRYFADRSRYLGDPDFFDVPKSLLLDPNYVNERRNTIDPDHATASSLISPGLPETSSRLGERFFLYLAAPRSIPSGHGDRSTTCLSVRV